MAFIATELSVLAYANNFTLWHYTTTDDSIEVADYFNGSADITRKNDLIIANVDTDGTPATKFYIVTGSSAAGVIIAAYA